MHLSKPSNDPGTDEVGTLLRALPAVPTTIAAWDSGLVSYANEAAAALFGVPSDQLVGRSVLNFYDDPKQRSALQRVIEAGGGKGNVELALRRPDGKRIWVEVSARRLPYRGVDSILAISRDITALKERERELAEARELLARHTTGLAGGELRIKERAAEAANRAKSIFLAHMSHELRSPLNSILGFSELIRDLAFGRQGIDKYREYGAYIHQAGTHLLALIDDILDLAKVEAGKLELQPVLFDVGELLDECARMMRPMTDRRGLGLTVAPESRGLSLMADRRRTKQMVLNLLSNAIKFTLAGGRVELAAQRMPDQGTMITVTDTGVGMTEEQIALALEPFGRVGDSATSDPTGTGLGLPIVKSMIEAHQGKLLIASQLNRGTTARLYFPPAAAA